VRILHVVGHMNRNGAETWLVNVLRHIDRTQFQFDFLVHADKNYAYGDEIRSLGGRLLPCRWPSLPFTYARDFGRILENYGPYDIVHCHVNHFGGWILRFAKSHGVPRRIAHSHSAPSPRNIPWILRLVRLMDRRLGSGETDRLAVSESAARSAYGAAWATLPNTRVLVCGIDLTRFDGPCDRDTCRRQFGIRAEAFVIGHVGRFVAVKNHRFVLAIARAAARTAPEVQFLLVGDGPLRREMEQRAKDLGLSERIVFAGSRPDVPYLMQACMDAFVLPSRYEGLGLAAIEAQAAGLFGILADTVPPEAVVCPELVRRLSLAEPAQTWANALLAARIGCDRRRNLELGRETVRQSRLNILQNVEELLQVYRGFPLASHASRPAEGAQR
jgi:glycosyltransferase involved in cell wall biosynthesis